MVHKINENFRAHFAIKHLKTLVLKVQLIGLCVLLFSSQAYSLTCSDFLKEEAAQAQSSRLKGDRLTNESRALLDFISSKKAMLDQLKSKIFDMWIPKIPLSEVQQKRVDVLLAKLKPFIDSSRAVLVSADVETTHTLMDRTSYYWTKLSSLSLKDWSDFGAVILTHEFGHRSFVDLMAEKSLIFKAYKEGADLQSLDSMMLAIGIGDSGVMLSDELMMDMFTQRTDLNPDLSRPLRSLRVELTAYEELYADLFASITLENPDAVAYALSRYVSHQGRAFSRNGFTFHPYKDDLRDPHQTYNPIRRKIWSLISGALAQKPKVEVIDRILEAILKDIEEHDFVSPLAAAENFEGRNESLLRNFQEVFNN